jgi:hypothetical protein
MSAAQLRGAARRYLAASEISAHALARRERLSQSDYVQLVRWLGTKRNPRTRRRFQLPLRLRLAVARAIGFEGSVFEPREIPGTEPPFSPSPPLPSEKTREEKKKRALEGTEPS